MFISCQEAKDLVSQGAQLIDVRTPEEFRDSMVPGSTNLPLHDIDAQADSQLDKNQPVVVFCRSGQRSQMAMQILRSKGFDAHNMGSFMAWSQC